MTSKHAYISAALLFAVLSATSAVVLIEVNISDPSAVTFKATGAPADINDSSTTTFSGATLLGFFRDTIDLADPVPIAGDLTPSGATEAYELFYVDNHSGPFTDLNLYRESPPLGSQAFNKSDAAFTGTATIDFSIFSGDALPTVGTTGDLIAGYSGDPGGIIGQWTVVPEMSSALQAGVMGTMLLGWLAWRRRSSGQ